MKMKTLKISSVLLILFACVFAKAQVIESVSYTPAKSGKYSNLATKNLTVFNGSVDVGTSLIGRGEVLQIDVASSQNISFASDAQINSAKDLYLISDIASLPSLSVSKDGKFISTVDTTVAFAPQATEISGGDVNFGSVTASLASDGKLNIDTVRMENPNCTLKWVKLPAYTQSKAVGSAESANLGHYWFAYCDYSPCPDGQYFYSNACHLCPLGKTNIASTGQTPNCVTITTALEDNVTMVGTCSAGWDGTTCLEGGTCSNTSCVYGNGSRTGDSYIRGSFTCSSQVVKKCTLNELRFTSLSQRYGSFCNHYDERSTTESRIVKSLSGKKKTSTTVSCKARNDGFVVESVYNEAVNPSFSGLLKGKSYYIADPTESGSFICTRGSLGQNQWALLNIFHSEGIRKTFCGFGGTSASAANTDIKDKILSASASVSCVTGTEVGLNNYPYCSDLLVNSSSFRTDIHNASGRKEICAAIKQTYTGTLGNSFTCIWKGPELNKYKAARAAECGTFQEGYDKCVAPVSCTITGQEFCPKKDLSEGSVRNVMKKRPWDTNSADSEWVIENCANWQDAIANFRAPRSTDTTIYLPQVVNDGSLLSCAFSS